ncbi:MAG TPA: error-prone DNA polymerase [Pyrinomonadaceae bacterium]|nr:error-prone DNA polymerase [Pyrinomonadaceae bacterium]
MTDYVELHARSAFSFLEGSSSPEELVAACLNLEMPAMALLDRDGVYGSPRFHLAAMKNGIKAHIGAEITVVETRGHGDAGTGGRGDEETRRLRDAGHGDAEMSLVPHVASSPSPSLPVPPSPRLPISASPRPRVPASLRLLSLPLLVKNRTGYQNLCRLITLMKLRVPKHARPGECAVTPEELTTHVEGLICLTGREDTSDWRMPNADLIDNQQSRMEWLMNVFGKQNIYIELQRHFNRHEEARNQVLIELARRLHLPLLATNGVHYATAEQREVADVFTCIRNHVRLEQAGRLLAQNSERFLKPAGAMAKLFADLPEAVANTVDLSARLGFTLEDLGYEFPKYPVPPGESMASFLRKRTHEGARLRYTGGSGLTPYERARPQIERELALIEKLKLEGYFLIVWDIIQFCKREGILVQGRGSAANSAVCYSLGITAVDPVGMELLFERFLSEERGEWPDIDLDLPSGDQRERAIQYVYQRYGQRGAAMTANVITYRGRSAAREVGKVLGFDDETLGRLSGLVHTWEWKDPKDSTARQFRDAGLDLSDPKIKKFFQLYQAVQDLPRHLGQHSGGMVICQGQLDSVVPLEPAAMPGRVVVQWDKEDCADLGLIKVDLLGLGMMAVLEDSIQLIRDAYSEEVDLAQLPPDDPKVYAALQKADTIGMFQVESRAQMSCLPRLRPQKFYDIVVQVAIIRPGPIVGNMVHPYLKRRQGRLPVAYPHPSLEPVLKRTLGVPLFQEQLLKVAMICAGFSGGEAEELRRAFGFKRSEARMKEIEVKLRRGMERNGITGKAQDEIVQSITSFALYGFPESHAASFALIAYASAYLKCHYLEAFTAAILNNQPMGFYQPFTIIKDAQRHGLRVLPVDVTRSEWLCTLEDGEMGRRGDGETGNAASPCPCVSASSLSPPLPVPPSSHHHPVPPSPRLPIPPSPPPPTHRPFLRLGLCYVKGLREEVGQAIARERSKAPFAGIDDLHNRVPELRKDELRKLAAVGALNFIQSEDPMSKIQPSASAHRRDALWQVERVARPAGPLFERLHEADGNSPLAPMNLAERLDADFRGTGLTIGRHPVARYRDELNKLGVLRASELKALRNALAVRVAGWVIVRQRPGTAKGFLFLSLEDETGIANIIVTPQLFDKNRPVLVDHPFLLIEGILQNQDNVVSVKAKRVKPLSFRGVATASHDFH